MSGQAPPGDGMGRAIGLVYQEVGPEVVRATVPVTPIVQQPVGLVHGGIHSVIAESICSYATALDVAADGMLATGQSNSATFMRPIVEGTIHATATRRHAGRTTWIWDVELRDDAERLCALVRMTVAVRPQPK